MKEQDTAMHGIVIEEFELHLSGNASEAFHQHLAACEGCRTEVEAMTAFSSAFDVLKLQENNALEEIPQPSAAFYSRVASRINETERRSVWSLFALSEPLFRRLAFASLMILAALGSYLVTQETSYAGADAASIIAQHRDADSTQGAIEPAAAPDTPVHDRNYMLVTLASYKQQ